LERVRDRLPEIQAVTWFAVVQVKDRAGVYAVEEVNGSVMLADLVEHGVFLVSPWNDVAIDVAAKLNGPPPDDLAGDGALRSPPDKEGVT